jgi:hypothetical protein
MIMFIDEDYEHPERLYARLRPDLAEAVKKAELRLEQPPGVLSFDSLTLLEKPEDVYEAYHLDSVFSLRSSEQGDPDECAWLWVDDWFLAYCLRHLTVMHRDSIARSGISPSWFTEGGSNG